MRAAFLWYGEVGFGRPTDKGRGETVWETVARESSPESYAFLAEVLGLLEVGRIPLGAPVRSRPLWTVFDWYGEAGFKLPASGKEGGVRTASGSSQGNLLLEAMLSKM